MMNFEDVLEQYEPMISASIRKLNIYRDHDSFKQAGRVALWQAWHRFDASERKFHTVCLSEAFEVPCWMN